MKKRMFENVGLKISAVLLSVLLWLFVTSRGQSEIVLEVPVQFRNMPEGLAIVNSGLQAVSVTLKGQERLMKNIRTNDVSVIIDLGRAKKGEGTYYIARDDIKLPYATTVTDIRPSTIKLRLEETIKKTVPVRPVITGVPSNELNVVAVEVDPRHILIEGLKREISMITELKTEPIDVSALTETSRLEVSVDYGRASVKTEKNTVSVKVILGRKKT